MNKSEQYGRVSSHFGKYLAHHKLYSIICWLLGIVAVITAIQIAFNTGYNVHPDEFAHKDAFSYFENHWWPPDLNSSEVVYSPQGWSRVYTGEVVYLVYGRITGVASRITDSIVGIERQGAFPGNLLLYRLLNVALYAITLLIVFKAGRKHTWAIIIGLSLIVIPQITYIYSYANSDAWGLSFSVFLFLFAIMHPRALLETSRDSVILGILTGFVLLTKKPYWLILPFAYIPLGWSIIQELKRKNTSWKYRGVRNLANILIITFVIITPLRIIYPLTQKNSAVQVEQMREIRAREGFKPSNPTYSGYHLAARGAPFREIWADSHWWIISASSFYGLFGYMNVKLSPWVYITVGGMTLFCGFCTISFVLYGKEKIPSIVKLMVILAPIIIALNVFASLYNSWTSGFQPQGRYLFPSLVPLVLLIGGTIAFEPRWLRTMRIIYIIILYILYIYALQFVVLRDTGLLIS